jgi:hypothetical protein
MSKGRNKKPPVNFAGSAGGSKADKDNKSISTIGSNDTTIELKQHQTTHEQFKKAMRCRTSQRKQILSHLKDYGSITTIQAHQAGIMAPAARILELRHIGHEIETIKHWGDYNGMAEYVLVKLAQEVVA